MFDLWFFPKYSLFYLLIFPVSFLFIALETLIGDSHDISSKKDKYFRQLHLEQYQVVTLPDSNDKVSLLSSSSIFSFSLF